MTIIRCRCVRSALYVNGKVLRIVNRDNRLALLGRGEVSFAYNICFLEVFSRSCVSVAFACFEVLRGLG